MTEATRVSVPVERAWRAPASVAPADSRSERRYTSRVEWRRRLAPALSACATVGLACPSAYGELAPERLTDTGPWVGLTSAGFYISRLAVGYSVGPELGTYLFHRLRVEARVLAPLVQRDQCQDFNVIFPNETGPWYCVPSGDARIAYGASVGYALVRSRHWAFAPGIAVLGTDLDQPGLMLGLSAPVDWAPTAGVHASLALAFGLAVAQNSEAMCSGDWGTCTRGATRDVDYGTRSAGMASLTIAWDFGPRP